MRRFLSISFFLIIGCSDSKGQNTDVTSRLNNYLQSAHHAYRFNGVALVVHKNNVILNKGYGFSDMNSQMPNTPDTRFPILSITKTFTATIILRLQDEKKLSVDDKLTKYFPDYPEGSKITIHHLLTHSSGIYNYSNDVGEEDSAIVNYPVSKERVLSHFRDKPLNFPPGKYYSYNNSGFFLLGLIIEKVTGKPYETVVREYIFTPLGMTQSGFDFNGLPKTIKAQGYQFWDSEKAIPYKHFDSTFAYATGAIYSTTNDMLKWSRAITDGEILTPKTWKLAFGPKIQNYGYGWQTGEFSGKKYVKHSGGYPGYMSEFIYYPDENLTIVLLNNFGTYGENVWAVGMGISSAVFGLPYDQWKLRKKVTVAKDVLQSHTGKYKYQRSTIEVKLENDKLFAIINESLTLELIPENENDYFFRDFNTSFHFEGDILIVHEHGEDSRWIRVER